MIEDYEMTGVMNTLFCLKNIKHSKILLGN